MKKNCNSSKGYTLVELLAVIVIIGILLAASITAVIHFIGRARDEQKSNQEKTLAIAAENYLQENRSQLPKNIGETTTISLTVLKNNKYITENIKNSSGESCMENSYVTAYKKSKTKYIYKAYLYCGSDEVPEEQAKAKPTISIDFVDANGNSIKNDPDVLNKVAEAKFTIEFGGGEKTDGKKIAIDGYSYSVLAKTSTESGLREVYSSGTLSANRATNIIVNKDNNLKDYIDISSPTTVAIKATVRNIDGGINDKVAFIGSDEEQAEVIYHDKTPPQCVTSQIKGEPAENDWININTPSGERKITVGCKDGSGSGCVRSSFTKTWNGNESAEFDVIKIRDNAGNTTDCKVRVNVDKEYPVISLDAFAKASGNDSVGNSVLTGVKTTENSSNASASISSNEYTDLYDGYMSSVKYPNGVIYKVNLSDNVSLKNWKWEVNKKGIKSNTDNRYETVGSVDEAKTGTCSNKKNCSFNITFTGDGLRKGILTVYDKAGNKATYTIYANVDKTGPSTPTITNSSNEVWTNQNVNLTIGSTDELSGIGDYYYSYSSTATANGTNANSQWVKFPSGSGTTSFTHVWTEERNGNVYIKACDRAGNCSNTNSTKLMIDRTAPAGLVVKGYKKKSSGDVNSADGLQEVASNKWIKGWEVVIPSGATDSGSGNVYYKVTVTGASSNVVDDRKNYRNVNADGTSTVSFRACDKLDNCSAAVDYIAKIDNVSPTKPIISNSAGTGWAKSLTLTALSSDSLSGMGECYFSYSSTATEIGTAVADADTKWVKFTSGSGTETFKNNWASHTWIKTVYIKTIDLVGNESEVSDTVIKLDNTAPTKPKITNSHSGTWVNYSYTMKIASSDAHSGIGKYQYRIGSSGDWVTDGTTSATSYTSTSFSKERNSTVYWRSCDKVGNCSSTSSTSVKIDKTKPTCKATKSNTGTVSGVTIKVTCSDGASGVASCPSGGKGYKTVKTYKYTVKDHAGNSGSCSTSVTSYQKCEGCLYSNSVYTGQGCSMELGSKYYSWKNCRESACTLKGCNGLSSTTSYGCCYKKCNCKTYYK